MPQDLTRRAFVSAAAAGAVGLSLRPRQALADEPLAAPPLGSVILFQGDSITDVGRNRSSADANRGNALGDGYPFLLACDILRDNPARGLPTVHALITLFDAESGAPVALLEGTYLTAIRTGAVTGLAVDLLAAPDAKTLTIIGAGGTATAQIEAVCAVRPIECVNIVSRGTGGVWRRPWW